MGSSDDKFVIYDQKLKKKNGIWVTEQNFTGLWVTIELKNWVFRVLHSGPLNIGVLSQEFETAYPSSQNSLSKKFEVTGLKYVLP